MLRCVYILANLRRYELRCSHTHSYIVKQLSYGYVCVSEKIEEVAPKTEENKNIKLRNAKERGVGEMKDRRGKQKTTRKRLEMQSNT